MLALPSFPCPQLVEREARWQRLTAPRLTRQPLNASAYVDRCYLTLDTLPQPDEWGDADGGSGFWAQHIKQASVAQLLVLHKEHMQQIALILPAAEIQGPGSSLYMEVRLQLTTRHVPKTALVSTCTTRNVNWATAARSLFSPPHRPCTSSAG